MNNTPPDEPEDDVDAWIARLRAARSADPSAGSVEDQAMRQAIIEYHQRQEAELLKDAQSHDHAWQQMRFRLKKEGLLQAATPWKTWVPVAMAAAILAVVALPSLMAPGIDVLGTEPATLRGGGHSFKVQDPLGVAKGIAKELKALDPGLKLHWVGGVATIDTDLEAAALDRAEDIVRSKVPPGKDIRLQPGFNRLELSAPP